MADTFDPSYFEEARNREATFKTAKANAPKMKKAYTAPKKKLDVPNRKGADLDLVPTTYFGKKVGK